jgi:hypothetical protein
VIPRWTKSGAPRLPPTTVASDGNWRNIAITLIDLKKGEQTAQTSVMAFHEKAGRSQVEFGVFLLDKVFSPAESPLTPCFHSHSG